MSGTEKPNYFDVMRPFGRDGYRNLTDFEYNGFPAKKVKLFDENAASFELFSLPYAMQNRFVQLLPSQALRLLSYTSKDCYSKCLSVRGIEVQVMYVTYMNFFNGTRIFPLENGKLILEVAPNRMTDHLRKMFPHFKTDAFLLNLDAYEPHVGLPDYVLRNYKNFYFYVVAEYYMDMIDPFLHPGIDTVEIKMDRIYPQAVESIISKFGKFEKTNVKTFSLEIHFGKNDVITVDQGRNLLLKHRPKTVQNLFYCSSATEMFFQYGNSYTISLYDDATNEWIVQAIPDVRSSIIRTRTPMYLTEYVIIPYDPGPNIH